MFDRKTAAAATVLAILGGIYAAYYLMSSHSPAATQESKENVEPATPKAPPSDPRLFADNRYKNTARRARYRTEQKTADQSRELSGLLRNFVFGAEDVISDVQHEAKQTVSDVKHDFKKALRQARRG